MMMMLAIVVNFRDELITLFNLNVNTKMFVVRMRGKSNSGVMSKRYMYSK
jgi:hypothetical protein